MISIRNCSCAVLLAAAMLTPAISYAASRHYCAPLVGAGFSYDDRAWRVVEGSGAGRILVNARNRRFEVRRIVVSADADIGGIGRDYRGVKAGGVRHESIASRDMAVVAFEMGTAAAPASGVAMAFDDAGVAWRIDCIAAPQAKAEAYFVCREFVSCLEVGGAARAACTDLGSRGVIEAVLGVLVSDERSCRGLPTRMRRAAREAVAGMNAGATARVLDAGAVALEGGNTRRDTHRLHDHDDILVASVAERRDAAAALKLAAQAAAVRPGGAASCRLGELLRGRGEMRAAHDELVVALGGPHRDRALSLLADIAAEDGDIEGARRCWKKMGGGSAAKAAVGVRLALMDGAFEDALALYDDADLLMCGAAGAQAATDAARAADALGDEPYARMLLDRALAHDPNHVSAYKELSLIELRSGDVGVVGEMLSHALDRVKDKRLADEIRSLIAVIRSGRTGGEVPP